MDQQVVVVIGVGGMGEAIARAQGVGRRLLIADFNDRATSSVADTLEVEGYDVTTAHVDVSSRDSVKQLAHTASELGPVVEIVHTAGLSPAQADTAAILRVDLYGVAAVLDEFRAVIAMHGAAVVIASMAGHMIGQLPAEQEAALMTTAVDDLLALPFLQPESISDPGMAYTFAKRANILRVRAESVSWGRRHARVNSISPGIIATSMGRQELDGAAGAVMRTMITASGTARVGTPTDIVKVAAFLLGPDSAFVTGTDLLVDGGVTAAVTSGALNNQQPLATTPG